MIKRKNILVLLKKKAGKEEAPLRCRVSWDGGNMTIFSTGFTVCCADWEAAAQRLRARSFQGRAKTPATLINRELDRIEQSIIDIFADFDRQGIIPSAAEFRAAYDELTRPKDRSIFPHFDEWVKAEDRPLESTKKLKTVRNHLYAINPAMTFDDLEATGMADIIRYLSRRENAQHQVGLSNTTINKLIAQIKAFVRWAVERGYCQPNRFTTQRSRLKQPHKTVIFLDWDELMTVYRFDFGSKHYLSQVRDVFCFCCFTGLRYSDVRNLKTDNISDGALHIVTLKTNSALTIELNDYSREILNRYSEYSTADGAALPVISNQKMNAYLKEIGQLCGIDAPVSVTYYRGTQRIDATYPKWQLLSSHAGRRTFVCNALMLGIAPDIVMKWTGHSGYKAMKPYIDVADSTRRRAMDLFNRHDDDE
jgi:integrase